MLVERLHVANPQARDVSIAEQREDPLREVRAMDDGGLGRNGAVERALAREIDLRPEPAGGEFPDAQLRLLDRLLRRSQIEGSEHESRVDLPGGFLRLALVGRAGADALLLPLPVVVDIPPTRRPGTT